MDRNGSFRRLPFRVLLIAMVLAVVQACTPAETNINVLQGISLEPTQTLALNKPLKLILNGVGSCTTLLVDWGDGNIDQTYTFFGGPIDLSGSDPNAVSSRTLSHTFTGWGGGKTVTVEGKIGCIGKTNVRFNVPPLELEIGWNASAPAGTIGVCQTPTPPGLPGMIPRMLVHATATTVVWPYINFGCALNGCVYDADGKPGSVADSRFPFQGKREYSIVYRIGTQVEQGGTNTQFTTKDSGPLEFCLNDGDNNLTNNFGAFNLKLSVDQLGP